MGEAGEMSEWRPMSVAPRDATLIMLRHRFLRTDPWTEEPGWWEDGPADMCWYAEDEAGEHNRVDPQEWRPLTADEDCYYERHYGT